MASRFRRNRAPGWSSSDEAEESSSEGEVSEDDIDEQDHTPTKRLCVENEAPSSRTSTHPAPIVTSVQSGPSSNRKVNNIWGDVLADQMLSGGLSKGVNVMTGDTFVPRGSETYDCAKEGNGSEEKETTTGTSINNNEMEETEEAIKEPFHDDYAEGPDLMAAVLTEPKSTAQGYERGRKRPWKRGGHQRRPHGDKQMEREWPQGHQQEEREWPRGVQQMEQDEGGQPGGDQAVVQSNGDGSQRRGAGRGQGYFRGGRGRGRGRGRGNGSGNSSRSNSGSRYKMEKISLNENDPPETVGLAISRSLREPKSELIKRATFIVGTKKAIQIYEETVSIENSGGKLTLDGRRRRTAGGVWLFLIREDKEVTEDQKNEIFGSDREEYRKQLKAKRRIKEEQSEAAMEMETADNEKILKDKKDLFLEEALSAGSAKPLEEGLSAGGANDVPVETKLDVSME